MFIGRKDTSETLDFLNILSYIIFSFDNFVLLKYNSSTCIQITKTMYQYNSIHQNVYTRILVLWIASVLIVYM